MSLTHLSFISITYAMLESVVGMMFCSKLKAFGKFSSLIKDHLLGGVQFTRVISALKTEAYPKTKR